MTKKQKRHIIASAGTVLFMLLLFLLLWFIYLTAVVPEQEEGIEVAFGEVQEAGGYMDQQSESVPMPSPQEAAPKQPTAPAVEEHITTDDPEALAMAEAKKKREAEEKARQEAERKAREAAEAERKAKEAEAIAKANAMGSLFGNTGNTSGSGDGKDSGQKGNPIGHGSSGSRDGRISGLGGRNTRDGNIPEPTCEFQHYGVVVVKIRIDKDGNVIHTSSTTGTDTGDQQMIQCAINAIKKTKWTAGDGVSEGTITYTFNVK